MSGDAVPQKIVGMGCYPPAVRDRSSPAAFGQLTSAFLTFGVLVTLFGWVQSIDVRSHHCLSRPMPPGNLTTAALLYVESLGVTPSKTSRDFVTTGTIEPIGSFRPSEMPSNPRREAVRDAVRRAWDAYEADAWGFDELKPMSGVGEHTFAEGLGTTIVDSLSTLYVMGGLDGRYERAREWVDQELRFDRIGRVIVFETVIRILGGLMSTFHLSGDVMYLRKAEELGARLAVAFETPHGLPWPRCYLNETGRCEHHEAMADVLYLAEVGTVQLEYRALSHHSTNELIRSMRNVTERIVLTLQAAKSYSPRRKVPHQALLPFSLSLSSGTFSTNLATLGAPADSYFEYLVKMWVQGNRTERHYWDLFAQTMDAMVNVATYRSRHGDLIVRDVLSNDDGSIGFLHKMDHFSCYIPGMIVLGLDGLDASDADRRAGWERLAADLTETCYKMYTMSPSGLSGEHIRLGAEDQWRMSGGYHLRPEAVEAFFYMYRHTGDDKYRDWAWHVFESIEEHCRTSSGGYAIVKNARARAPRQGDVMHSFVIAETFKYLFLIFGDDKGELPLSKWVFNTEAHPLLITPSLGRSRVRQQPSASSADGICKEGSAGAGAATDADQCAAGQER
jgi:mannosyl-oligosaccharide alpha-1,2-mannosidase